MHMMKGDGSCVSKSAQKHQRDTVVCQGTGQQELRALFSSLCAPVTTDQTGGSRAENVRISRRHSGSDRHIPASETLWNHGNLLGFKFPFGRSEGKPSSEQIFCHSREMSCSK